MIVKSHVLHEWRITKSENNKFTTYGKLYLTHKTSKKVSEQNYFIVWENLGVNVANKPSKNPKES